MAKPILLLIFVASTSIYLVDGMHRRSADDDGPSFNQESSDNKYNVNNDPDMNQKNVKEVLLDNRPIFVGSILKPEYDQANEPKKVLPLTMLKLKNQSKNAGRSKAVSSSSTITPLSSTVTLSSTTTASQPNTPSSTIFASTVSEKVESHSSVTSKILKTTVANSSSSLKSSSTTPVSFISTSIRTLKPLSTTPLSNSSQSVKLLSTSVSSSSIPSSTTSVSVPSLVSKPVFSTTVKYSSIKSAATPLVTTAVSSTTVKSSSTISSTTVSSKTVKSSSTISSATTIASSTISSKTQNFTPVRFDSSTSKIAASDSKFSPVTPAPTSTSIQTIKPSSTATDSIKVKSPSDSRPKKSQLQKQKHINPIDLKAHIESVVGRLKRSPKGVSFSQKSNSNKNNTNNRPNMKQENVKTIINRQPLKKSPIKLAKGKGLRSKVKKQVKTATTPKTVIKRSAAVFSQEANENVYNVENSPRMRQENSYTKIERHLPLPETSPNVENSNNNYWAYRRSPAKGPTFNQRSNKNEYNVNNRPKMNQSNIKSKILKNHPIVADATPVPVDQSPKSKKVVKRSPAKGITFNQRANKNEYNVNNRPKMNQSNVNTKINNRHQIIPVAASKYLKNKESKKVKRDQQSRRSNKPPPYRGPFSG